MTRSRITLLFSAILGTALLGLGVPQPSIRRTAPERQGNAWVEQIHFAIPVAAGRRLVLRADRGSVEVSPGPPNRLICLVHLAVYSKDRMAAAQCLRQYQFKAQPAVGGVLLNGQSFCGGNRGALGARFDIQVPLDFSVDIQTQGGNIGVQRLDGQLRAETTGGNIRTGDVRGPVWVSTDAGMIDLGNIGQTVNASTAGGNIHVGNVNGGAVLDTSGGEIVAGIINGPVTAQTGAGDIIVKAASGPVEVETAGGQIHLGECGNSVRAQTAAGNILVAGARGGVNAQSSGGSINLFQAMGSVVAQTAAGHILAQIDATRKTFGPSRLDTQVGNIAVSLSPQLPVTIHAAIVQGLGHRIVSDFPLTIVAPDGRMMMGPLRGDGKLMGGGDGLDIRTTMGNILIRRLNPADVAEMKTFQQQVWTRWRQCQLAQAEYTRRVAELQRHLELHQARLQKSLQDLDLKAAEAMREQQAASLRNIQGLEQQIEAQITRAQAQRAQHLTQLQQQLEQQTSALQQQMRELEQRLARRMRERMQSIEDQQP